MALTNNKYSALPKRSYIQGFWRMEETSGTRYDLSDNHNDLSDINTVGYEGGVIGNAAKFIKANSERLETSTNIFTEPQTELSSFNWVYVNAFNHTGDYISTPMTLNQYYYVSNVRKGFGIRVVDDGTNVVYLLYIFDGGSTHYAIYYNSLPYNDFNTKYAGKWLHIGFTFKGSQFMKLYIDGVCVAANTTDIPAQMTPDTTHPTYLGYTSVNAGYLDGKVDEAILYNIALSDSEVAEVYKIKYKKSGILLWWF